MYLFLRHLHITCAVLSVAGFALRGGAWVVGATWPKRTWVRRLTDTNDGLLLSAAIGLVLVTHQYPIQTAWVTTKVVALLAYIGLGIALFRFAGSKRQRLAVWLLALTTAAFIISVAITKSPYGFFGVLASLNQA